MKTFPANYRYYVCAAMGMLLTLFTSLHASAQQVGFYPVAPTANGAYGHTVGDLNKDGRDDLVTTTLNGSGPTIVVDGVTRYISVGINAYLNNADGSFAAALSLPTDIYSKQTGFDNEGEFVKQLADINGDGFLDVILRNVYRNNGDLANNPGLPGSAIFLGLGNARFNPAFIIPGIPSDLYYDSNSKNTLYADFNNDGRADLVGFRKVETRFNLVISLGDGNGGFTPSIIYPIGVLGAQTAPSVTDIAGLAVSDLNNDGWLDIATIFNNPTAVTPTLQSIAVALSTSSFNYQVTVSSLPVKDFTYTDIIAQKTYSNGPTALLLVGNETLAYLSNNQGQLVPVLGINEKPVVFSDFNNDGLVDVITFISDTDSASTFRINKGVAGGGYASDGIFTLEGGNLSNATKLSGPYRFGSGATPGVLESNFNFIFFRSSLTPVVTRPGPQKQLTSLSLSLPSPILSGQAFTLAASVTTIGATALTGTVSFKLDGVALGSAPLVNGIATFVATNGTSAGAHQVIADYSGDANNNASSTFRSFSVDPYVPPLPKIVSVSNVTVKEGQKAAFKVSLDAATTQISSVTLSLADITATSGLDYSTVMRYSDDNGLTYRTVTSGSVASIKAGVTSFMVEVTALRDGLVEPSETYTLSATSVSGLAASVGSGTGTILNKSRKEKDLFEQVRGVADSANKVAETFSVRLKNWVMSKPFTDLFSWR